MSREATRAYARCCGHTRNSRPRHQKSSVGRGNTTSEDSRREPTIAPNGQASCYSLIAAGFVEAATGRRRRCGRAAELGVCFVVDPLGPRISCLGLPSRAVPRRDFPKLRPSPDLGRRPFLNVLAESGSRLPTSARPSTGLDTGRVRQLDASPRSLRPMGTRASAKAGSREISTAPVPLPPCSRTRRSHRVSRKRLMST